ncbi:hypothetical protein PR048_031147 [Dryococelus australis]|uniref:CRAL-TRIO domain-containing protein n=1 Tax=Dryococelus australis TaxID=614101 RepID=A0ABQ9G8J1_9NEOP|nr:hypothetical protein PR048_031147 [Dryococelus australis]
MLAQSSSSTLNADNQCAVYIGIFVDKTAESNLQWGRYEKQGVDVLQKAMPLRLKQIHIVNEPPIFSAVLRVLRPFMQEKLKSRFFCHGKDMSSLHRHIDPSCLPEDFGGSRPRMDYTSRNWYLQIKRLDAAVAGVTLDRAY